MIRLEEEVSISGDQITYLREEDGCVADTS